MAEAPKIVGASKSAVSKMFAEVRMGKAVSSEQALVLVDDISALVARNVGAITSLVRLKNKDDYTYMHSVAVCALMVALARQLKLEEDQVRQAGLAGLFHDVGKMQIDNGILDKPGSLSDEEFLEVKPTLNAVMTY